MIDRRTLLSAAACLPAACRADASSDGFAPGDHTAEIQRRIDLTARTGGTVVLPAGIFRISAPLNLRSGVALEGSGRHYEVRPDGNHFTGTWLRYEGPADQPALRFRSSQNCSVRALGIHCGEHPQTIGIEIGSNNNPACKTLVFEQISIFGAGTAVRWGLGNALTKLEQCDDISFRDIGVYSCINGFDINAANVSDYSIVSRVSFSELRAVAFHLSAPGFMTIENCAASSLYDECIMFRIVGPSPDPLRIIGCQMEPKGHFLVAEGPNDQGQIILEANVVNVPIRAKGILRFESRANYVNTSIDLDGYVRWRSRDDVWDGILGQPTHIPQVHSKNGAQFVASALANAVRYMGYHLPADFRIEQVGNEIMGQVVVKAGVLCPAFVPGDQAVGSYVQPTRPDGKAYRVLRPGNAPVEPDWSASIVTSGAATFEHVGSVAVLARYGILRAGS